MNSSCLLPRRSGLTALFIALFLLLALSVRAPAQAPAPQGPAPKGPDRTYPAWDVPPASPALAPDALRAQAQRAADRPGAAALSSASLAYTRFFFQSLDYGENWAFWRIKTRLPGEAFEGRLVCVICENADSMYPKVHPTGSMLAFTTNRDGNFEIYTANIDGRNMRRLTFDPTADSLPTWSPDGSRIAFTSNRTGNSDIFWMNPNGSGLQQLTFTPEGDFDPDWSSDGQKLVWVHSVSKSAGQLMMFDLKTRLLSTVGAPQYFLENPAWSPSGGRIAFEADVDADGWLEVAVMNANGANLRVVAERQPANSYGYDHSLGDWDGNEHYLVTAETTYTFYNGRYYIVDSLIYRAQFEHIPFDYNSQPQNTDYQSIVPNGISVEPVQYRLDSSAGSVQYEPVPQFSQAPQTVVKIHIRDLGEAPINFWSFFTWKNSPSEWQDTSPQYANAPPETVEAVIKGEPGETVHGSTGILDRAYNYRQPPLEGEVWTTFYHSKTTGRVTDARGYPIQNGAFAFIPGTLNQPVSALGGDYQAYFIDPQSRAVTVTHPGYADFSTQFAQLPDPYPVVLPGPGSLSANGQFEQDWTQAAPPGWRLAGSLPAGATGGHSGKGARLGILQPGVVPPFEVDTVTFPEMLYERYGSYGFSDFVYGPDGTLHALAGCLYAQRAPSGEWSVPEPYVRTANCDIQRLGEPVVDSKGGLHILVKDYGEGRLKHMHRPVGGAWTAEVFYNDFAIEGLLGIDAEDRLHIVFKSVASNASFRLTKEWGQPWSTPEPIFLFGGDFPEMQVTPDGTEYFFLNDPLKVENMLMTRTLQGVWTQETLPYKMETDFMKVGTDHTVHIFGGIGGEMKYCRRDPDGTWHDPVPVETPDHLVQSIHNMEVAPDGTVYLAGEMDRIQLGYLEIARGSESFTWHEIPRPSDTGLIYNVTLRTRPDGRIEVMLEKSLQGSFMLSFHFPRLQATNGTAALSQQVRVPVDMHAPTLSFLYWLEGQSVSASRLVVWVTPEGGTRTRAFTGRKTSWWEHAWVDVSPWAGKTITISFDLNQAASDTAAGLSLDEITVAPWTTPVIEAIAEGEGWVFTVKGQNFLPGAQVLLDGKPVTASRVDEHTITVPAGAYPGLHRLTVRNADGTEMTSDVLRVGYAVFVPMARQ